MAVVGEIASIITLCETAFVLSKSVYNAVDSFKSQRQKILDIQGELGTLTVVLDAIQQKVRNSPGSQQKYEILRAPIECCTAICTEMKTTLAECTKHTKDSGTSVRDWLKMQYRGGNFDAMKQRLAAYKSTLSITFDSINFQEQGATQEALTTLKTSIEDTKEDLIDQLTDIKDNINDASKSLKKQLQTDQTQIQDCLNRLTQAQSLTNTIRPQINISRNTAGQGARAIFGTDNVNATVDLTASDNTAQAGSTMASGVYSPETMQALLKGTSAADIMAVLQSSHVRPVSATTELLQATLAAQVGAQVTSVTTDERSRTQGQNLIENDAGQRVEEILDFQATRDRVAEPQT